MNLSKEKTLIFTVIMIIRHYILNDYNRVDLFLFLFNIAIYGSRLITKQTIRTIADFF